MEVVAAVGGALLSFSFEKLFDKLASPHLRQFASKKEVRSQLAKWGSMLPIIHAALEDAEDKQTTSRVVEIWLSELRDLVYDLEDVLDDFATEVLQLEMKDKQQPAAASASTSSSNTVKKFLPFQCTAGSIGSSSSGGDGVKFSYAEMGSKLEELTERMEAICSQKRNFNFGGRLVGGGGGRRSDNAAGDQRLETTSLPDPHVFGRDNEKQAILDLVLAGGGGVSVIPIQGMGGLGKTTLAQLVYNDERVVHFDLKAWVCVSDTFNIPSITKTVLQYVGGESREGMTLDQLQVELKKTLSGKKFVIVLDDVWNESYQDWTVLCKPFEGGAPGSTIIVTTRNQKVATMMGTVELIHGLRELSFADCLSLFCQHALKTTNFGNHPNLKDVGEKIVKRCKGLPLAAKALGGMLSKNLDLDAWVEILESQIWDLPEDKNDILPVLRLSYHHLPSHLKQCFAYCAIFPKDYEFDMNELVQLWLAEGFVLQPKGKKHVEDVGVAYFCDLLSRSFFQQASSKKERFLMHDLIHDLALCVAREICFNVDSQLERASNFQKVRHSSFTRREFEVSKRFEVLDEEKSLRTLLALPVMVAPYDCNCISNEVLNRLLSKLKHLRALSLSNYEIRKVPESVKYLKHLRYMNLSRTTIRLLPDFVCSLLNLQSLLLRECKQLEKLPTGIGSLTNLSHLDISGTNKLKEMPVGIGNLTYLRVLGKFIVGVGGGDRLKIRELKGLSYLKGGLSIQGLHNVEDFQQAREADLKGKKGLESLVMEWSDKLNEKGDENVAAKVLESLQPYKELKRLVIRSYYGRELPSWIGDPLLMSNMVQLELCKCSKSTSLLSLGRLPKLKHLTIDGMMAVTSVSSEIYGCDSAFLALETLKFKNMLGWEEWCLSGREGESKFPSLCFLEISNCPSLVANGVVSLPSLYELKLEGCNASLLIRCMTDITLLKTLSLGRMSGLSCLGDSVDLENVRTLKIYDCEDLTSLLQIGTPIEDKFTRLRSLVVSSCPQLVSFFTTLTVKKLVYLEKMIVRKCPKIGSVQMEQQQDGNDESGFPLNLRHVELEDCGEQFVESVVNGLMMRQHGVVELLEIKNCDSLRHLGITSTRGCNKLKRLNIEDCNNLASLYNSEQGINNFEIEEVEIKNCPFLMTDGIKLPVGGAVKKVRLDECNQLESLPDECIMSTYSSPTVVREIKIWDCLNLKRLPDSLHSLTNLTSLELHSCVGIELFPDSGLPIPNLQFLQITNGRNLRSLPKNMHSLTSLVLLRICGCPGLELITEEQGCLPPLPPNLTHLEIMHCSNMKQSMSEWGLDKLTSLQSLIVAGLSQLPEDEATLTTTLQLPTSLTYLCIGGFKKLESITSSSWGIQNLTSLTYLCLGNCPKLRYLPKEGLPPTLQQLHIIDCSILVKKCSEGKGKYWPLISLIPHIHIQD